ncbi:MAG TPA: hypothetical protein VGQ36_29180 [Thermoanaerobaculia bacterium]|jgi:hypothetical protein|nr:hypothetical protein [Thermoanaerobaculia bacterium]
MKTAIALCLLFASTPLFAQYGPPAKDLDEAFFFMQEIRRQLEPALNEARDQAEVFHLVSRMHNKLIGKEPATEVSAAIDMLDDYLDRRGRASKTLSRENEKTIASVRKELELQQPPYAILALRERLHHEFVHNLERQALKNLKSIERLEAEWEMFVQRNMRPAKLETMSGITATAAEMN